MNGFIKTIWPFGRKAPSDNEPQREGQLIVQPGRPGVNGGGLTGGGMQNGAPHGRARGPYDMMPNALAGQYGQPGGDPYGNYDQGGAYNGGAYGEPGQGPVGYDDNRYDTPYQDGPGYEGPAYDTPPYEGPGYGQAGGPPPRPGGAPMGANADQQPQSGWLTANSICKTYGKRQVVKDASITVRRGESVGLLGPNGAGKTTIFYMITGLVAADEGNIHIDGYEVTQLPMYRRARLGIGYLPQEASIFRGLTVEQNIMAVLEVTEPNRKKRREKLESLLNEFNITRLRKSPSISLSGGERRRCEIARALASDPSYILLDEPFAGIDPIAIGDIRELVRHLTDRGIGVLITDHNVRETLEMIDRAYIIHDGMVLTEGTPYEIVSNDDVRRVYLGDMFK